MGDKYERAKDAANKLSIFLQEEKWTQTAIAKKLGYSGAVINQFLQNKYPGDTEDITNRIINFLNTHARKKLRDTKEAFIETTVAKQIYTLITETEACSDDENEGKIGLIIGDSGHGKTKCLKAYAETNHNSVYVELDEGMNSTAIFNEIASCLGIHWIGSLSVITRRLIEHLRPRNIIVILDEASNLKIKQLNQLRQIIVVKSRCPLILAGNNDLKETILQPRLCKGSESLDQFTSRLMYILNLDDMAENTGGGLYTIDDIIKLYQYGGLRLTTDAIKKLRTICLTPNTGRLRSCRHIINLLHLSKEALDDKQIDEKLIMKAIRKFATPLREKMHLLRDISKDKEKAIISKTA